MPFRSRAQRRWMYAAEARGEMPKGTASRWQSETPKGKKLPEKVDSNERGEPRSKSAAFDAGIIDAFECLRALEC